MSTLDRLLPHRPPMRLIDRVVEIDAEGAVAEAGIDPGNPFFVAGFGVPAWVGIEYMAQCTALIGGGGRPDGAAREAGMLLGARGFEWSVPWFENGSTLQVSARCLMRDGRLAVYAADIAIGGRQVAGARVNIHMGAAA